MLRLEKIIKMLSSTSGIGRGFRTVVVEGNIASGKSTFLEYFRKFENCKIFAEPVDEWRNMRGFNMLDLLYRDSQRWSFAFQMYADLTRVRLHQSVENLKPGDTKLMERSLYSGKYCFAENNFRSGKMDPVENAVLDEYFRWMTENQSEMLRVDLIVYLRTKPEVCHQRLLKRCRQEETAIPLEYIQNLHVLYEEWLMDKRKPIPAEVIVVDADGDLPTVHDIYDRLANRVLSQKG